MWAFLRVVFVDLPIAMFKIAAAVVAAILGAFGVGTWAVVQRGAEKRAAQGSDAPPSGFYRDPWCTTQVRWWDGKQQQWTPFTQTRVALVPAGWYRDVDDPDMEQFWDGAEWTGVVRAAPGAPGDAGGGDEFEESFAAYDKAMRG